jgi:uncharacterized protein YpbB
MIEELTEKYEDIEQKYLQNERVIGELRHQANEFTAILHDRDTQLTLAGNQIDNYVAQLAESEDNYKLMLSTNQDYEKITTDQAHKYNEIR